jgi:hypothetical protein
MFLTVRPELHENYAGEKIPASDFQIEAEELAKIGLVKKWIQNTDSTEKKMPTAFYIGENVNSVLVRPALNAIRRRTNRKVSATFQESSAVYFDGLEDAVPQHQLGSLWKALSKLPLSTADSNTGYSTLLTGTAPKENLWALAALGTSFNQKK